MDANIRKAILSLIPYGLYIVGAKGQGNPSLVVVNWITQVSFHPPLLAVAVERGSRLEKDLILDAHFTINMLEAGRGDAAKPFLKRSKVSGTTINGKEFLTTSHGIPYLPDAIAYVECTVVGRQGTGDHTLVIGEVTGGRLETRSTHGILTLKETGWKYSR